MKLTDYLQNLGSPVAYYPKLTHITGGVKETLFLCQLLYWEGKQVNKDGWIYKTQEEMFNETGLSRYEQETARRNLKSKGFIEDKLKGIPAKHHYKINFDAINSAWETYAEDKPSENDIVAIPQSSLREYHKLDCREAANSVAAFQQTITENTIKNTTHTSNQKQTARKPFRSLKQEEAFDQFWKQYPKQRSKGQAEKTWVKINPDDELLKQILKGLETAKRSIEWQRDGGQYIPYPSTWLNAKGWEDVYKEAKSKNYVN